ncbi:MAG: acyl-CoA/acyl-ACP dehydrogenase, partial [Actinomycetota bacterium]|nr:acyl-CoA/acyl-ACP dehydrogenase [Actinomycetota bacterium]
MAATGRADDVLSVARRLADDVLFAAAAATDAADAVPLELLDALAAAGLYGLAGPPDAGGLGLDPFTAFSVIEALAGGCLATTFVWVQHHGLVRALAAPDAPPSLRDEWLAPLCRGERRAGIALAGLLPGPPLLTAQRAEGGWTLDGTSPWVTGWGRVDVLLVAARGPHDTVVSLLVDAAERPGLVAERQRLVAVDASATVRLRFSKLAVPGERLVKVAPWDEAGGGPPLRANGSLALGVTGRCCKLLGPSPLDADLDACRRRLDAAPPPDLPAA